MFNHKKKKMISAKRLGFLFLLLVATLSMPGCSKEDSIVGTWYGYTYYGPVTVTFNADGSFTETTIDGNEFGNYTYNNESQLLTITYFGDYNETEVYKATLTEKTLTLTEMNGMPYLSLTKQ